MKILIVLMKFLDQIKILETLNTITLNITLNKITFKWMNQKTKKIFIKN